MTLDQAIEKEIKDLWAKFIKNKKITFGDVKTAFERIATLAQSPLMLKGLLEKTRRETRETMLEEAARVCENEVLPANWHEIGITPNSFSETKKRLAAAIRALPTHDTV